MTLQAALLRVAMPDNTQTIPTTTEPNNREFHSNPAAASVRTLAPFPSCLMTPASRESSSVCLSAPASALGASQLPRNQILLGLSLS